MKALEVWEALKEDDARRNFDIMQNEFPDQASPTGYWHDETNEEFVNFFTWGHDHNFGHGFQRRGAMSTRHVEIISECIQFGFMPSNLDGKSVLNIGCWSGGDLLGLAGLGARVSALEEHKVSAAAAKRLCGLVNLECDVHSASLFEENKKWRQAFDIIYMSGVIYHVTDPLLALRICFGYLKLGGTIVLETKASSIEGSYCEYAGTLEKGWNWYAPTRDVLGRWLVDAGFESSSVLLRTRQNGRLLAGARKTKAKRLPDRSGFSRPGSWLEDIL